MIEHHHIVFEKCAGVAKDQLLAIKPTVVDGTTGTQRTVGDHQRGAVDDVIEHRAHRGAVAKPNVGAINRHYVVS